MNRILQNYNASHCLGWEQSPQGRSQWENLSVTHLHKVLKSIQWNPITCLVCGFYFSVFWNHICICRKVGTKPGSVFSSNAWGLWVLCMMIWSLNGRDCLLKTSGVPYLWVTVCRSATSVFVLFPALLTCGPWISLENRYFCLCSLAGVNDFIIFPLVNPSLLFHRYQPPFSHNEPKWVV